MTMFLSTTFVWFALTGWWSITALATGTEKTTGERVARMFVLAMQIYCAAAAGYFLWEMVFA